MRGITESETENTYTLTIDYKEYLWFAVDLSEDGNGVLTLMGGDDVWQVMGEGDDWEEAVEVARREGFRVVVNNQHQGDDKPQPK